MLTSKIGRRSCTTVALPAALMTPLVITAFGGANAPPLDNHVAVAARTLDLN